MKKVGGLGSGLSGLSGLSGMGIGAEVFIGFLDDISDLASIYSVRRTLGSYTGSLLRLRRDSDNAESNFGPVAGDTDGNLDISAITTWLGGATPFITIIYEQVNGDNVTQAVAGNQAELTENNASVNNKPTWTFDGGDDLQGTFGGGAISQPNTIIAVVQADASIVNDNNTHYWMDGNHVDYRAAQGQTSTGAPDPWAIYAGGVVETGNASDSNYNIWTTRFSGATSRFWLNGIAEALGPAGTDSMSGITIGSLYTGAGLFWVGNIAEIIIIDADAPDADKNTIGQNQDTYFDITYTDI